MKPDIKTPAMPSLQHDYAEYPFPQWSLVIAAFLGSALLFVLAANA